MTMTATVRAATQGRSRFLVAVVFFVFFVISFLTNILGPLIPDIIADFHVSLTMVAILPFAFFIAYGVMSIPAGFAVQRWGEKKPMVASFVAATLGATSFAAFPSLSNGRDFALRDRGRDGGAAGGDQSAVAGGRRRGALCIQLSIRAAHLRCRFLRESPGLFRSRGAPRSRASRSHRASTQSLAASPLPRFRGYRFIGYLPWSPAFASC